MIYAGIDAIEIDRFRNWALFTRKRLKRIFNDAEIDYCLSEPLKSAERFAVRFAAREALYKALSSTEEKSVAFLLLCRNSFIELNANNRPILKAQWQKLSVKNYQIELSLTHTQITAIALVLLSTKE